MTDLEHVWLDASQLELLRTCLHRGAQEASQALATWIGKPSVIEVDSIEQCPLEQACELLAAPEEPICFCAAEMQGLLSGEMILAFDDPSGLALADMLLDEPLGATVTWSDISTSAAEETTNILVCAYMNSLAATLSEQTSHASLIPAPPQMRRDFAGSLLECALFGQAVARDHVIVARTRFEIDGTPLQWTLLFIPDAESMERLAHWLSALNLQKDD